MLRYFFRRILLLIPILLGVTFIIFTLMEITPSNPGRIFLGTAVSEEAVRQYNEEIGYYDPFIVRYGRFLLNMIKLDFGTSYSTQTSIKDEIVKRFPISLRIAFLAVLFATGIGTSLGVLSAIKQYTIVDNISRFIAIALAAIPFFWLGLMLIYIFAMKLGWLPSYGITDWKKYILPTLCLAFPYGARTLRMTRSCMLETIREGYIRTARAKGAKERAITWRHAFKNALLPIITLIGMQFGALLGGAIVTETIFSMPGLGSFLITAIRAKDTPVVLVVSVLMAATFCSVMLFVDILYATIDPRIKAKFSRNRS